MFLDSSRIRLIIGGILTVSIALNFFCLGWYASNVVLADRVPALFIGGTPPPRDITEREAEMVALWSKRMSAEGAQILHRSFDERRDALKAQEASLEEAVDALKATIKSDSFRIDAVRTRMNAVRSDIRQRADIIVEIMTEVLPALSAEDRAVIADVRPGPAP